MSGFPPQDSSSIDATLAEPSGGVGALLGDRYRLLALLGFGQSSRVYLGEDTATGNRVAVKGLRPWLSRDAVFLQRFRGEATALAQLSHPNVVNVLDWGATATETYLVVEAFGGGSLGDLASGGVRLSPSQALLVGLQAAQGLQYAHSLGWAHRDLKPTKLLFTPAGRLGIGGFGIARVVVQAPGVDAPVNDRGRYRPPEEVVNDRAGRSADVYALAVILIEAVTGGVPLLGDGATMTKALRAETDLPVPEEFGSLQAALEAAGRRDPATRLSAAELVEALTVAARALPRPRPIPVPDVDELLAQEQAGATQDETIDLRDGDETGAPETERPGETEPNPDSGPTSPWQPGSGRESGSDHEFGGGAAGRGDSLQAIPISVPVGATTTWPSSSTLQVESVAPHRPIADTRPVQALSLANEDNSAVLADESAEAPSVALPLEESAVSAELMSDPDPTIDPPPRRDAEQGPGADSLAGIGRSGFGILLGEVDLRPAPNHAPAPGFEDRVPEDRVPEDRDPDDRVPEDPTVELSSFGPPGSTSDGAVVADLDLAEEHDIDLGLGKVEPDEVLPNDELDDESRFIDGEVTVEAAVAPPRRKESGVFGLTPIIAAAEVAPTADVTPVDVTPVDVSSTDVSSSAVTQFGVSPLELKPADGPADEAVDSSVGGLVDDLVDGAAPTEEMSLIEADPSDGKRVASKLDQARPVRLTRLSDPTASAAPQRPSDPPSAPVPEIGSGINRMSVPALASATDTGARAPAKDRANRLRLLGSLAALVVVALIVLVASGFGRAPQEAAPSTTTAPTVVVGSFIGRPLAEAEAAAEANGWTLVTTESFQAGAEVGEIVGQEPGGGRPLVPGGELTVAVSLGPEMVTLPSIVGLPVEEATVVLSEAGLPVGAITQTHDEAVPLGQVLSVRVEGKDAPDQLAVGIPIDLVVSAGAQTTAMPSFVGLTKDQALIQAEEYGLVVVEETAPSDLYEESVIVDTQPPTGAAIRSGDTLTLVISTGAPLAVVPDLAGATPTAATELLTASGFVVVDTIGSPDQPVVATDPAAGERHVRGTQIVIVTAG